MVSFRFRKCLKCLRRSVHFRKRLDKRIQGQQTSHDTSAAIVSLLRCMNRTRLGPWGHRILVITKQPSHHSQLKLLDVPWKSSFSETYKKSRPAMVPTAMFSLVPRNPKNFGMPMLAAQSIPVPFLSSHSTATVRICQSRSQPSRDKGEKWTGVRGGGEMRAFYI